MTDKEREGEHCPVIEKVAFVVRISYPTQIPGVGINQVESRRITPKHLKWFWLSRYAQSCLFINHLFSDSIYLLNINYVSRASCWPTELMVELPGDRNLSDMDNANERIKSGS